MVSGFQVVGFGIWGKQLLRTATAPRGAHLEAHNCLDRSSPGLRVLKKRGFACLGIEVDGAHGELIGVGGGRHGGRDVEVDGTREHEPVVVVGVLPDQVHAPCSQERKMLTRD